MSAVEGRSRSGRGDADIGHVAALIGDPHRARILLALTDGRAHPASEIADAVGLKRSAATSHLRRLADGDLVRVEQVGRFRLHTLAGPDVARLVEALAALAPAQKISSLGASNKAAALREGRTCYDHLAGRLGVAVADSLRSGGAALFSDPPAGVAAGGSPAEVELGPRADDVFAALEVDLAATVNRNVRRPVVRLCVDWSERRFHLAGSVGAAMLESWLSLDWLSRRSGRAVQLTPAGRRHLEAAMPGIQLDLGHGHPDQAMTSEVVDMRIRQR